MGGIGSGKGARRKAWRSKKMYIGSLPGFCIPELIKMHQSNPNSTLSFNNINVSIDKSWIRLESASIKKLLVDSIKISSVPCNYGGFRYFGHCPTCYKRVRILYLYKTIFACCHCLGMVYFTQNATLSYRLRLKAKAVKSKISDDVWTKPKCMRKKTFAKLRGQYFDLDEKKKIADFFSLRNIRAVDGLFAKYGCAIGACEAWEMQYTGQSLLGLPPLNESFLSKCYLKLKN